MTKRSALLGSFVVSLLLTGCPLTDHYQLMSDLAGAPSGGSNAGGANQAGAPSMSGAGGHAPTAGSPDGNMAGEAGEAMASGGTGGLAEVAGSGGSSAGTAGSGTGGDAGASESGGTAGSSGNAGSGGSAGAPLSCGTTCTASQTCCISPTAATCATLTTDAKNCGACGNACNAGRTCAANACKGGWVTMAGPPTMLAARSRAAIVAMDKSVFIWGGQDGNGNPLRDGAIYRPSDDSWTYLPIDTGVPSSRIMASGVWTGSVVVVFGGSDVSGNTLYRDGATYDPSANSWTALPANGSIKTRSAPFAFWDGTRAFFWSGIGPVVGGNTTGLPNVDRFDLTSWSISGPGGDPGALLYPAVAFDGSVMYSLGGQLNGNRIDKGYTYSASTDMWAPLAKTGFALSARSSNFGAWDGTHFVVWGGRDDNGLRNDGQYFSANKWTTMSTGAGSGAPSARMSAFRRSGWSFSPSSGAFAVIGGQTSLFGQGTLTTTGASYNVAQGQWTTIPQWPSGVAHEYGMGVWTGEEFVLWGGRDSNGVSLVGERWAP